MIIKESKIFNYEEKIAIIKEVQKAKDRSKIARLYQVGESTIRGWERDLKSGKLKNTGKIILPDLFDCNAKTDLIEFCEIIKDEVTDKFKSTILIPFMMEKGYKESELINFFEITKTKFKKFKKN